MKKKFLTSAFGVVVLLAMSISNVMATPPGTWGTDVTMFNMDSASIAHITFTKYDAFTAGGATDPGHAVALPNIPSDTTGYYIAAGGSYYYNPANDPNFGSSFNGSVVLSSDKPLAAIVSAANNSTGTAYASDTYGGISKTSAKVILPIVMARLGTWNTRVSIQNAGTVATDVTIKYVGANAPAQQTVAGLPANQAVRLDQYDSGASNFNGSAVVTSTGSQQLAVTVEEYRTGGGVLITYNGVVDTDADTTVYMPGYIDQGIWTTDFTVVNNDAVAAPIIITFTGITNKIEGTIAPGGSAYFNNHGNPKMPTGFTGTLPTNYYGSATVVSTGGKVVSEYNISNNNGGPGNANEGYVGFPNTAGATTVVVPLIENMYSTGWETTFTVQNIDGGTANLSLTYGGNKAANCNPCTADVTGGSKTFNQGQDGHIPTGFIGGVKIVSTNAKRIVVIGDQANFKSSTYAPGDTAGGFTGFGQ
jgi:hypothetical protein